jgi:hypothetical protein
MSIFTPSFAWYLLFFGDCRYKICSLRSRVLYQIKILAITFKMKPYTTSNSQNCAYNERFSKLMLIVVVTSCVYSQCAGHAAVGPCANGHFNHTGSSGPGVLLLSSSSSLVVKYGRLQSGVATSRKGGYRSYGHGAATSPVMGISSRSRLWTPLPPVPP